MRFVSAPLTAAAAFIGLQTTAEAVVHINVDLTTQSMHVSSAQGGDYEWAVSTGRPGYRTPTGSYHPQAMYVMHHSAKYENAPMPHAIFFYGGYAIHGTYSVGALGGVASHGCIRLAPENAATLFNLVKHEGASIVIGGHAPGREQVADSHERHRGGQRLAAKWRNQYREQAFGYAQYREQAPAYGQFRQEPLGYAPQRSHRTRSLRSWADNPLENQ